MNRNMKNYVRLYTQISAALQSAALIKQVSFIKLGKINTEKYNI